MCPATVNIADGEAPDEFLRGDAPHKPTCVKDEDVHLYERFEWAKRKCGE